MFISQIVDANRNTQVVARNGTEAYVVKQLESVYSLALEAISQGTSLNEIIGKHGLGEAIDLEAAYNQNRILVPIYHRDPAHLYVSGTGLTHLGSATTRGSMHEQATGSQNVPLTDSTKMFEMGLADGKPAPGKVGVQPEWYFKGNGNTLVAAGSALTCPSFADECGEEPEIAGIYVIGEDGTPFRVGYALANEFSDHAMGHKNHLYLAHSKLRHTAIGPEILIGDLPKDIRGQSRILRHGEIFWEKPFLSGEDNMSHTLTNLEHHHFKYPQFRHPGDIHVHMFGTSTLSFADGVSARNGDVFEIEAKEFGLPLRNVLTISKREEFRVKAI